MPSDLEAKVRAALAIVFGPKRAAEIPFDPDDWRELAGYPMAAWLDCAHRIAWEAARRRKARARARDRRPPWRPRRHTRA
jgi:hypothetical protein